MLSTTPSSRLRATALFTSFEAGIPLVRLARGAPLGHAIGNAADYVAIAVCSRSAPTPCSTPNSASSRRSRRSLTFAGQYDVGMEATPHDRGIDFLEIDRDGCMRMLAAASGGVGRIALSVSPATIRPVNYAFDDQTQSVVFRSALGSKLREGLSSGTAAFEIDGTDPVDQTGWSVIIVGEAEEVTDPAEIERLEDFELESWDPGVKTHWVRIRATSASGRRIVHDINYY